MYLLTYGATNHKSWRKSCRFSKTSKIVNNFCKIIAKILSSINFFYYICTITCKFWKKHVIISIWDKIIAKKFFYVRKNDYICLIY